MKDSKPDCPICEKGFLEEITYVDDLEIRGKEVRVEGLVLSICSHCSEETMSTAQMRANNKLVAQIKFAKVEAARDAQGLLSGEKIRALRETLGVTQQQAAHIFGGGANAFSKYERGETVQSEIMDRLLRISIEVPGAASWLISHAGIDKVDTFIVGASADVQWGNADYIEIFSGPSTMLWSQALAPPVIDLPDSPNWEDVPLVACAGWR